jgi:hypothetical protein
MDKNVIPNKKLFKCLSDYQCLPNEQANRLTPEGSEVSTLLGTPDTSDRMQQIRSEFYAEMEKFPPLNI